MALPHLDPVSLAGLIGSGALALTRLLSTAKPVWDKLPPFLQGLVPALVLVLPQIAAASLGVHTSLDLMNLVVLSVALILPGAHSHTVGKPPPASGDGQPPSVHVLLNPPDDRARIANDKPEPPTAAITALAFACLLLTGCAHLGAINWPKTAACAQSLDGPVVKSVAEVLAGIGDVESELTKIAETSGADAVICAVKQIVSDVGSAPVTARASRQVVRGRAFLASVQQ